MSEQEEVISLDDPSLMEAQVYDPEADRDAYIPAPELDPQGNAIDYMLKLSLGENKFKKKEAYFKNDKNGQPMGILMVDARIVQPGGDFDNSKLRAYYLNTYIDKKTKASGFTNTARLLFESGQAPSLMPKGLGVKAQADFLVPLIAAEPILGGRVQWNAYCGNCEEEKKQLIGERNWPEKDGGGHKSLVECPDCGTELVPGVGVKRFMEKK